MPREALCHSLGVLRHRGRNGPRVKEQPTTWFPSRPTKVRALPLVWLASAWRMRNGVERLVAAVEGEEIVSVDLFEDTVTENRFMTRKRSAHEEFPQLGNVAGWLFEFGDEPVVFFLADPDGR